MCFEPIYVKRRYYSGVELLSLHENVVVGYTVLSRMREGPWLMIAGLVLRRASPRCCHIGMMERDAGFPADSAST